MRVFLHEDRATYCDCYPGKVWWEKNFVRNLSEIKEEANRKKKEGISLVMGWVQFKSLIAANWAFYQLKDYRKPITSYSIPSPVQE